MTDYEKLKTIQQETEIQSKAKVNTCGEKLLKEWQIRLGLQDWRIHLVEGCDPYDMTEQGCSGCTVWTECNKTARIEIMDPVFYGDRIVPYDYEKTLVHELLHLKTSLVSDMVNDFQARYMHQMIDDLARAFVDAKRFTTESRPKDIAQNSMTV